MKLRAVLAGISVAILALSQSAQAAVVTVDVTIKAVNPQARGITVVYRTELGERTIELDVSRKAEITVNGKAGTLDSLGPGLKGKVSYDKDLAIVTKIDVVGTPIAAKRPELVELSELNVDGTNDHPWLSEDGLTIYWDRTSERGATIWTAHRSQLESTFDEKKSLFSGKCPTVSSDGLEMILVGQRTDGKQGLSLQRANRESLDKPFGRPTEIVNLRSHIPWAPCLSVDGLALYFESRPSKEVVCCTREDKESSWSNAQIFDAPGFRDGNISLSMITPDGLTLFGQETNATEAPSLMMLSRSSTDEPFGEPKGIRFNNRPLYGYWPRYVSTTQELFFVRVPTKDGQSDKGRPIGIWVVKNFTLPK